ncbi:hypothetical protein CSAL01_10111 [Colletotrichum salicis]|uniref:FAS1 domain-containing protein n=1 Tax=Colletotrichum salicis TaxID=1209931 RepID=A0A135U978_9PEZI|nr:hypothetical protein CSAL01_10111 [Colletotrichum salicis]
MASVFSLGWVYHGFFFVFLVGSAICGWASTSEIFIVGRAVSGIGAAAVTSGGGLTVVLVISSPQRRPLYIGLCSSCFALGLILAPIIGGAFTEKLTWRWCFWINLPGGAVTLFAMFLYFKLPPREGGPMTTMQRILSLDLVGSFVFVPGIFMLILALQWGGNSYPWKSAIIIGLLVGSIVMLGLFAVWESRLGDSAVIPGVLVTRRTVLLSVIFSFYHLGALSVSSYYLPEWFQAVQGATPFESGIRVLPSVISQIVGTICAGAIVLMCTAAALYTQFTVSNTPSSQWIGFQVIQGLGVGFSMQIPSLMVQVALRDRADLLPIGVSLNIFAQFLGATVAGIANVRVIVDQYFPSLFDPIMESYNSAIAQTHVFYRLRAQKELEPETWWSWRLTATPKPRLGTNGKASLAHSTTMHLLTYTTSAILLASAAAQSLGDVLSKHGSTPMLHGLLVDLKLMETFETTKNSTLLAMTDDAIIYLAKWGLNLTSIDPDVKGASRRVKESTRHRRYSPGSPPVLCRCSPGAPPAHLTTDMARGILKYHLLEGAYLSSALALHAETQLARSSLKFSSGLTNISQGAVVKLTASYDGSHSLRVESGNQKIIHTVDTDIHHAQTALSTRSTRVCGDSKGRIIVNGKMVMMQNVLISGGVAHVVDELLSPETDPGHDSSPGAIGAPWGLREDIARAVVGLTVISGVFIIGVVKAVRWRAAKRKAFLHYEPLPTRPSVVWVVPK